MTAFIEDTIRDFLLSTPGLVVGAKRLGPKDSLIAGGLIDSMAVLDIVQFLEARFNIQFEAEDLTGENFDSITAMAALVRARMPANP